MSSSQDEQGLHTFLKDAVPLHKLSDSQAALAALDQPHLDWGELDSTFVSLLDNFDATLAEQLALQLGRLVQEAGLPSLATGLFAYAGHLVHWLFKKGGANPVRCKGMVLQMLGNVAHLHGTPHCPRAAEVSVAAVNLGTALARDIVQHHAGTRSAAITTSFLTQLTHAASKVATELREGKEVPKGVVPWAAAVMSCSYLLALQYKDTSCPNMRAAVWKELVPMAFALMSLGRRCNKLPNHAEWQSLVQPAVLLASIPRLLVRQLGLQQKEAHALAPLDHVEVMRGLVSLVELLSRWYHPYEYNKAEAKSGGSSIGSTAGSRKGGDGSKVAGYSAGSSGSNNAGGNATTSTAAEGGGSSGSGADEGTGGTAAGVSSSTSSDAEGSSMPAADTGSGGGGSNKNGAVGNNEGHEKAGKGDQSGARLRAQVGRALSATLASLQLLLRGGVGVKYFVQAYGVEIGVNHIYGYMQYLKESKQRQHGECVGQSQQQEALKESKQRQHGECVGQLQQQGAEKALAVALPGVGSGDAGQQPHSSQGLASMPAGDSSAGAAADGGLAGTRSNDAAGEGESEEAGTEGGAGAEWASVSGPPGDDPAHQLLVTLIDCLCMAMKGESMEEAQGRFLDWQGYQHTLNCLDETPPMAEMVKQAEEGRPYAWAAKRSLLRLIEAALVGRDICKAAFDENGGFDTVWRCMSLLSLSLEAEERLLSTNPGIVRGVLGNALSLLSGYAARNYEDEVEQAKGRCKQLVDWLEDVAILSLPMLLAVLKWQPRGYDSVQAALQGESAGILSLHGALLTVAWRWLSSSPRQVELLAGDPSLRAPFLGALRLPEEDFQHNQRAITSAVYALTLLIGAHPSCVPELLEGGLMQDLLRLLLHCFQSGVQEETKLQALLRAVRARGISNSLSREQERTAIKIYSTAVAPFLVGASSVTVLLQQIPLQDGCHKASVLASLAKQQLLQEQLRSLLRKSGKFTDASLQTSARETLDWLKLVGTAKVAAGSTPGDVIAERASSQAAAELLRAEQEAKQRELAKLEKKRRQKEKQREREEREQQEREERERAEREGQTGEDEEKQHWEQEQQTKEEKQQAEAELAEQQQAAAGSGQQGKAAKKKKKEKANIAAAAAQQPATTTASSSSSSQGVLTSMAAPQQQPASSIDSSIHAVSPRMAVAAPATPTIVRRVLNSNPGYRLLEDTTSTAVNQNSSSGGSSGSHGNKGRGCRAADGSSFGESGSSSSIAVPSLAAPQQQAAAEPSSWPGLHGLECQWESPPWPAALEGPSALHHSTSGSAASPLDDQEAEVQALFSQLLPGLSLLSSDPSSSSSPGPQPSGSAGAAASDSGAVPAPSDVVPAAAMECTGQGDARVLAPALAARLRCALSGQQLQDPVVAADGWTYEREMITAWLEAGLTQSPVTGQPLGSTVLHPNYLVRQLLDELA